MDNGHRVLRPAMLWCDVRTTEQCRYITETVGEDLLVQSTCNPALEGFTAPKVIWVRDNEPEILEKTATMLLPKDYVRFRLTGRLPQRCPMRRGHSCSMCGNGVGLRKYWTSSVSDQALLPPVYESIDICGKITAEVAELTGLPAGTPVVGGGADNACSAVGNGIVKEGRFRQVSGRREPSLHIPMKPK